MQLQRVTKPQAVKLKEAGFDWDHYHFWSEYINDRKILYPRIETAIALKWLRDVKGILVETRTLEWAIKNQERYGYLIYKDGEYLECEDEYLHSWEQAESAGLDIALQLIIDNKNK